MEQLIFEGDATGGINQETFVVDRNDTGGNLKLQFGTTLNEYLLWDNSSSYFTFSDDVDFGGNQLINARIENASTVTCNTSSKGRLYFDTDDSFSYVCDGTSWKQLDVAAGSGSPGGSTTQVQYNSSGAFAGEAAFAYDATTDQLTLPGATVNEDIAFAGDISPTQITANQNDYNPTGLFAATVLRLNSDASRNITGLQGGSDGRILVLVNVGSNNIVLMNASASSTAANRFDIGTDLTLSASQSVNLLYDTTSSRWRILGRDLTLPAGATTQIQFNDASALGADADFIWDKTNNDLTLGGTDTGIVLKGVTNEPSAATSGTLNIYSKDTAGKVLPKWMDANGLGQFLQPALFSTAVAMMLPQTGTTLTLIGITNTAVGTVSTPTIASTNLRTAMRRITVTSAATAASASEMRTPNNMVWRGNAAGLGGFFYSARFNAESTTALQRLFVGVMNATAATSTSTAPSALTNILGVGWDSADTNLQFMANDASGTATKTDLGSNFPANSATAVYELTMFAPPNGSDVKYRVRRLDTAVADATGTISAAGDLPTNTTFLTRHEYMNNGGTAAAVILNIMSVYIESNT